MSAPVIGVDPGLGGAIALLRGDHLDLWDMPVIQDGTKKRVDHAQLAITLDLIAKWGGQGITAYVERVGTRPKEGSASAFSFGRSTGVILGALAAHFIPITEVTPGVWKRATGTPADKDGARLRASALMPQHAGDWPLKKHDGRAEAALIALYGASLS